MNTPAAEPRTPIIESLEGSQEAEQHREYPVVLRDPHDIEMHPLVACLPMFGPHTPEMEELRTRLDEFGMDEIFLSVDEDGLLFDGRHTLMIIRETDIEQVQCRVYPREEVPGRIRAYGMGRVHLSKSAKAYWWWPFYAARAVQKGGWYGNQHTGNLAKGNNSPLLENGGNLAEWNNSTLLENSGNLAEWNNSTLPTSKP